MQSHASTEREMHSSHVPEAVYQVLFRRQEQQSRRACGKLTLSLPAKRLLKLVKDPHTHGFVVEFENAEDRDYYVYTDPAHQEFVKFAGEVANGVKVVDYEPGKI
jgi:hypothetical protein